MLLYVVVQSEQCGSVLWCRVNSVAACCGAEWAVWQRVVVQSEQCGSVLWWMQKYQNSPWRGSLECEEPLTNQSKMSLITEQDDKMNKWNGGLTEQLDRMINW